MSRFAARGRKKDASDDEQEEEEKPKRVAVSARSKKPAAAAAAAASASAAAADDDFPAITFDMGDIEAELKEADGESASPPPKRRFPTRPPPKDTGGASASSSKAASLAGSRAGSRRPSVEKIHYTTMEELDNWRWVSPYQHEGDQTEARLAENALKWEQQVRLPTADTVDVAATMMFRKFLWKNKKLCRNGIPPQHRLFVWEVLSGAKTMPDRLEHLNRYAHYLSQRASLQPKYAKEIAMDISRSVLNGHPKYIKSKEGREELQNVLTAFAVRNPAIGYVNSFSHIAAYFLLYYKEEDAFWLLCALVDIVLPPDYFTQSLLGVRAECMLMKCLVFQRLPKLHAHFASLGVDVYNVALKWLMTLYLLCLSKEVIARVLDVLFLEGSNILVSIGLAFFVAHEKELLRHDDLMTLLAAIAKLGEQFTDNDELMRMVLKESRCKIGEDDERRRVTERKVMEDAYTKDLQTTQLHRKAEEERRLADLAATAKREKEEEEAMAMGMRVYKVGQYGEAKLTHISMEKLGADWIVTWESKRKKLDEAQMRISHCSLYFGLRHGNFKSRPEYQKRFQTAKKMAFSLVDEKRSLDVVCQTSHDIEAWRKLFYRSNFPLRNGAQVLAHRRRIEKKKTIKRMKAAAAGKQNVKIESSDDDYDVSDDELAATENDTGAEEKAASNGNGAGAASAAASSSSSTAPRFGAATSSRFARASANDGEKKEAEKPKKNARRKFEEDE